MDAHAWAAVAGVMAIYAMFCVLVCMGCVALSLKLYTEFIKEKKYREP